MLTDKKAALNNVLRVSLRKMVLLSQTFKYFKVTSSSILLKSTFYFKKKVGFLYFYLPMNEMASGKNCERF